VELLVGDHGTAHRAGSRRCIPALAHGLPFGSLIQSGGKTAKAMHHDPANGSDHCQLPWVRTETAGSVHSMTPMANQRRRDQPNVTGAPVVGQSLRVSFTSDGTARRPEPIVDAGSGTPCASTGPT
jgi:hypothetical protein